MFPNSQRTAAAIRPENYSQENQENLLGRQRAVGKSRLENQENVNPGRKALGVLESNRVQVQRGIKQTTLGSCTNNENHSKLSAENTGTKQPAFTIHVDEPGGACIKMQKASSDKSLLSINPTVTSLGIRQPLATIECSMDTSFDSPMVTDMSLIETEEKVANANEVPDYAEEIYQYLRKMELQFQPKVGYMKKQPDITNSMRAILVDWLVEVGEEYKLHNETLHLAVNYIDRFLSSMSVLRGKLQLVGTAAMLLASKFEEIYPPEVAEFVYITDDTYTKNQVLRMEHLILKVLSFNLAIPTINQFLTQYFLHQEINKQVESLSMFLGELSLIDSDPFLKYLPSHLAAAAFVLANYTLTGSTWPESLVKLTGYTIDIIMPCIMDLYQAYLNAPTHAQQSVREKYKGSKYHGVSLLQPPAKLAIV
ncbi:cyclin-A2 [Erpetoichthys calabaricus]|uniref:Cyclin-A2 n=1 Tax=Erpetoichthys calabaricus TaxID=27687 RepID=A0A8C4SBX2_ERPCA|nr:cyclin-A2 [Erpetoichthys calabaricus]